MNDLVARERRGGDGFILVHAESGMPIFAPSRNAQGVHATAEEALEWAERTYPTIRRISSQLHRRPTRSAAPRCSHCGGPTILVSADVWECRKCENVQIDLS